MIKKTINTFEGGIDQDTDKVYEYLFDNVDWPIPMTGMVPDIKEYYDAEIGSK